MAGKHRRRSGKKLLGFNARGKTQYGDRLGAPTPPRRKPSSPGPISPGKPRGILNEQAKELGQLQRELGEEYAGNGMTAAEAGQAIDEARVRLRRRDRESQAPRRGMSTTQAAELAELQRALNEPYTGDLTEVEADDRALRRAGLRDTSRLRTRRSNVCEPLVSVEGSAYDTPRARVWPRFLCGLGDR